MTIIRGGSQLARRREWRVQTNLRERLEPSLHRAIRAELNRAGRAAANGYANAGLAGVDIALLGHDRRIGSILTFNYRRVMDTFGDRTFRTAKSLSIGIETKDAHGAFERFLQIWIAENTGTKVTAIAGTTRGDVIIAIERATAKATADGLGQAEAATLVQDSILRRTGGIIGRRRALTIARTEIHGASQAANFLSTEALDLPRLIKKEWLNAGDDERVRDAHLSQALGGAGGQVRDRDMPFDVGGELLMYPGAPNGSPANVINCRCVSASVIPEGV